MARKDSEKDSERPHYYSQFWLDVAAGRRIIGAPKPGEETEQGDIDIPEPPAPRRAGRMGGGHEEPFMSPAPSNGHTSENIAHPIAEPIVDDEEIVEPEAEDLLVDEEQEFQEEDLEDTDIPDMDLTSPEEEDEDLYDEDQEEEEEEEEDDLGWSGRGRKRNKPTRTTKQPPRTKPKREPRRGY